MDRRIRITDQPVPIEPLRDIPAPAARPPSSQHGGSDGGRAGAINTFVAPTGDSVRLSEVVAALSYALDITEGQPMGHSVRSTMIGMRIATTLGLSDEQRSGLFYGLLLKDLGCSSNAARLTTLFGADDRLLKHAHKLTDWSATTESARYALKYSVPGRSRLARAWHALMMGVTEKGSGRAITQTRCERGADIAQMLGLPRGASDAIRGLDEHWDGAGMPYGLRGTNIPIVGRIASLAQTVEVFVNAFDVRTAYDMAHARRGRWFDPVLVDCLDVFQDDQEFWARLRESDNLAAVRALEPGELTVYVDDDRLDIVAQAFARVIDAKSPFTAQHSQNVALIAVSAAHEMGFAPGDVRTLNRAALLHDIGKLGVSNTILDKPSALDDFEMDTMRQHTRFTLDILKRVSRFRQFAATAAAHHERLNGTGYHLGLKQSEIGPMARLLAAADVTEAVSADRPYRAGMSPDDAFAVLDRLVAIGHLCPVAVEAVQATFTGLPTVSEPGLTAAA